MLQYKKNKSMIMAACYKSNDDDKFDNNKDKVCLFLSRWGW